MGGRSKNREISAVKKNYGAQAKTNVRSRNRKSRGGEHSGQRKTVERQMKSRLTPQKRLDSQFGREEKGTDPSGKEETTEGGGFKNETKKKKRVLRKLERGRGKRSRVCQKPKRPRTRNGEGS